MKRLIISLLLLCGIAATALGQESTIQKVPLGQAQIDKIIAAFTTHEKLFRQALTEYNFSRSATMQTVGIGGNITGTFRRDSDMTITSEGTRLERVLFAPVSTLTEISMTAEDFEDLGGINPFALEPNAIPKYNFSYVGKERIDELDLYVFDVTPKVIPDFKKIKERLFTGRIWVDDKELEIVKSKGKGVPEDKNNKFPVVETWRENIDGKYWFPTYISSDDDLVFDNGQVTKIRLRVKFNNYKLGHTDVKIIGEDEPVTEPTPAPTPKKP